MKKLTALMLVLLLLLCGCKAASPTPQSASPEDLAKQSDASPEDLETKPETAEITSSAPAQTEAPAPELVQTAISESGDYTDAVGNVYHYSYRVPVLTPGTEGASEINGEILSRFGGMIEAEKKGMEEGCSLSATLIDSEQHQWQNLLSLVITVYYDYDYTDYGVYCYDIDSGSRLTTRQLLEKLGIGEAEFLESVRAEALRTFDENYAEVLDNVAEEEISRARELTVSEECVNLDMMVYPGEDGKLRVIAPIGSLAGPAWYYRILTIE